MIIGVSWSLEALYWLNPGRRTLLGILAMRVW
jgi:hypothetical protein